MLQIGDFSKLSQVTIKALRHYDKLGLLIPAHVDATTGYRYYTVEQLPRLNRIIALKALGFSLEQVRRLLEDDLSPDQLRGMLKLREAEVQHDMAQLEVIRARLQQIALEGQLGRYDCIIKHLPAQRLASIRRTVPSYPAVGAVIGELFSTLYAQGLTPHGPPFTIYHDRDYRPTNADVEVGVAIGSGGTAGGILRLWDEAAHTVATTVHHGSYSTLHSAYAALTQWMQTGAYVATGPNREFYLVGPDGQRPTEQYVTELHYPIAPPHPQEETHAL